MRKLLIIAASLAAFGGALSFTASPAAACLEAPCVPAQVVVTKSSAGTGPSVLVGVIVTPPDSIVPIITLSQTIDASIIGAPVVSPPDPITPADFFHD